MTLSTLTVDSQDYEAYVSLDEANTILAVDPIRKVTWEALADATRLQYLIAATQRLDLLPWQGERTGGHTQDTAWPRSGLVYPDGEDIADNVIPADLERATALLAGSIAIRPAQADQGSSSQSISSIKAGSVALTYFRRQRSVQGLPLQDETAWELIKRWIVGTGAGGVGQATYASGTGDESEFADRDRYGLLRGV